MSRAVLLVVLGFAPLAASGCFDVHDVDPGPLIFDDFDDGTFQPTDPNFKPWGCLAFSPDKTDGFSCDHDTGYASPYSLVLRATINDPPDSVQEYGGSMLATLALVPEDFTRFKQLTFAAKLEFDGPTPPGTLLYVELACSTAPVSSGTQPGGLYVTRDVDFQSSWQVTTVALADFLPPSYQTARFVGGLDACLQRVDALHFTAQPALPDGQSISLTLHVDGIRLQ